MPAVVLEDIGSSRYRMNILDKRENDRQVPLLNIQDKVALERYVNISGDEALPTYKELKRYLRTGETATFNNRCSELIREIGKKNKEEIEEVFEEKAKEIIYTPIPIEPLPVKEELQPELTVKIFAGSILIRSSDDKDLWKMCMNSMI